MGAERKWGYWGQALKGIPPCLCLSPLPLSVFWLLRSKQLSPTMTFCHDASALPQAHSNGASKAKTDASEGRSQNKPPSHCFSQASVTI